MNTLAIDDAADVLAGLFDDAPPLVYDELQSTVISPPFPELDDDELEDAGY